ncbi:MAG: HD domain-containing protein [Desulfatibacillaceae bacterium]|nr:HD domain-containing protein [Desulfatibacillaceae bacterium]
MEKKTFVKNLAPGQEVESLFVAAEKQIATKKDGSPYLILSLSDSTGRIRAVAWDEVERLNTAFASGDFVAIKGRTASFRGEVQLTVTDIARVDKAQVNLEDFLPASAKDCQMLLARLNKIVSSVNNPDLARLLNAFFADEDFVLRFCKAPAAKHMHHAFVGGLLEHTLSVARLAEMIASHYQGLDRDLLVAGAILHDIGKIDELTLEGSIEYSVVGRLLSHIVIGIEQIDDKIRNLPDFDPHTALMLKHMVVSHHGSREFGSPEPPKTLEAVVLNIIDDLDAKFTAVRGYMENDNAQGDFTAYHRLLERHFYRGEALEKNTDE